MSSLRPVAILASIAVLGAAAPAADAASRLVIRGGGFGHGVGMSQYGAMGLAQHGTGYRDILAHYYTGTAIGRLDADPTIRVILQSGRPSVTFTGAVQAADRALKPGSTYRAAPFGGRVVLRSATGRKLRTVDAPLRVVGPGGAPVQVVGGANAGTYRGALEVSPSPLGGVDVVNALGLEDYVRGVVAAESPSSWPAEALKAQAVAARTYALTTMKPGAKFDEYPDTRSQVYGGVGSETPQTDAAVAATGREVVTYQGAPAITYFFSTSGGQTENVENSLGGPPKPWLKSVDDPYDSVSPRHRWGPFRYTLAQASRRLRGLVKGSLRSITVMQRGVSPRIVRAEVVGTGGVTNVDGAALRRRFGLYDTWAYFTFIGTKVKPAPKRDTPPPPASENGAVEAQAASWLRDSLAALRTPASAPARKAVRRATLSGHVTGVPRGTAIAVQRRIAGRWTTVVRTAAGRRGVYRAGVTQAGVYRVLVRGADGPSVRVR